MKLQNILFTILFLVILIASCHQRRDINEFYEMNFRDVGSEGDTIVFTYNYANDSYIDDTMMTLVFPPLTVDTTTVINYYEYYNYALDVEFISSQDISILSDFIYIMPFYGDYISFDTLYYGIENHWSLDFHNPVTFTYYNPYYEMDEYSKLYRIKIPKDGEWGVNIWVKFNNQGYVNGFDDDELQMIISGKWNPVDGYGNGDYSMINWEEITDFTLNTSNNSVTFDIYNTDYMYVVIEDLSYKNKVQ